MNLHEDKLKKLEQFISDKGTLLIAYSGGTDSSLLAVITKKVLNDKHLCVLVDSPLIPRRDVRRARDIAERYGICLKMLPFDPLKIPEIRNNQNDRCYHCKKKICSTLKQIAGEHGITTIADGTNLSDLAEYRPGLHAASEEGICHPFVEAGIDKNDIREIAREMGLEFWDIPSSACLASRMPYNEKLDYDKLEIIERGENILHDCGIMQCRVRLHDGGSFARIEVPENMCSDLVSKRDWIMPKLRKLGFHYITLDLEGYRPGNFDKKE